LNLITHFEVFPHNSKSFIILSKKKTSKIRRRKKPARKV
jgi:hypothetical protein